jgi:DNA-binding FrmR family transcriptional regulator
MAAKDPRACLAHRLRSAEGHLHSVIGMQESGANCHAILHQLLAVQRALGAATQLLLSQSLRECLATGLTAHDPETRQKAVEDVIALYELVGAALPVPDGKEAS